MERLIKHPAKQYQLRLILLLTMMKVRVIDILIIVIQALFPYGCQYILLRGANCGKMCGRQRLDGSRFCAMCAYSRIRC